MQRYIDADWIVQKLDGWQDQLAETYGKNDEYVLCLGEVLMKLDDTPTADVVEIVRCKDCKFWGESLTEEERNECDVYADLVCTYWMSDGLTRDDFCSKGERREDERS